MKVKYIKEGYFKNPEEARQEKERLASQTNAERLAKTSNAALATPIKIFLDKFYADLHTGTVLNMTYYSPDKIIKNDYFKVFPSFISAYYITSDGHRTWFREWRSSINSDAKVTDIDYQEKKIKVDIHFQYPILKPNNYAKNDDKAIWVYLNRLYNYYDGFNKNPDVAFTNLMRDLLKRYKEQSRTYNGWTKVELTSEDERILEYLKDAEYEITVYMKIFEDLILAPTISGCSQDFCNGNNEESHHYIDQEYYPITSEPWTWEKFAIKMKQCEKWIGEEQFALIPFGLINSYEDAAIAIRKCLNKHKIQVVSDNDNHIYLSKGCFNKDYLIV